MRHKHNILKKILTCCIALSIAAPSVLKAQFEDRLYRTDYNIDTVRTGQLRLGFESISFFHDNEFAGTIASGYTLPGLWLQPKLTYQPLKNIRLEVGMHALIFHGANKYPNYGYQDIATWKGDRFQRGMHLLPYFRAQLQMRRLNIVIGNIYGGSNHNLIEPLYSSELNLTADPEAGLQLLFDAPRFHFDAWVNWESFIFRQDLHRETFVVGISTRVMYNDTGSPVHFYSPVQVVLQHRGGEIDNVYPSQVSTLMNAAAGFGAVWNVQRPYLRKVFAEADILGYYQQNGSFASLDKGYGAYAKAGIQLGKDFQLNGGYFYGKDFISLFGLPYFGTISTKNEGGIYDRMHTAILTAEYSRSFGRAFTLGAQASLYYSVPGTLTLTDDTATHCTGTASYTFGVYFRANMDFLLKELK